MVICLFYSMLPVKNTFMYLAIMCQPVEDGSYKASILYLLEQHTISRMSSSTKVYTIRYGVRLLYASTLHQHDDYSHQLVRSIFNTNIELDGLVTYHM